MDESEKLFIVKKRALPEVLLKVVEAKTLLESEKAITVQEATEKVDISRSSFYKYKDDVFPFHENSRGRTLTIMLQLDDEPGLLSKVLGLIARYGANILTIHQAIPIGGIASLTVSLEVLPQMGDPEKLLDEIRDIPAVHYLKLLGME